MTESESDDVPAPPVKIDPERIRESYYFHSVFEFFGTDIELMNRGEATIDKFGDVHHEEPCPCPDGALRNQLRCKCLYKCDSDPYESFLCDPL